MTDELDLWLDDYDAPVVTVEVCGKAGLIAAHAEADAALLAARASAEDMLASADVRAARLKVEDLEAQMEASKKTFSFKGIGSKPWRDLKRKFPASQDQLRHGFDCDLDRFVPAAIAASSHEPSVTVAQATRMATTLPEGEYEKLYEAVLQANGVVVGTPKSVLAAHIALYQGNGDSSTTAAREESPEAPSSDDNASQPGEQSETTATD